MQTDRRLTKSKDFAAARRYGRSWSDRYLVLVVRPNLSDATRFGFSVGRRVGNSVLRNRIKRRLREAARLAQVPPGWDLVVIARRDAALADYHQLERSMTALIGRARVLS